ncbi:MAG: Hsp70 family protein, partial [Leptolyngbyaceae cyanobacterium bins.59]|nr:Hsp70 family protein [Leptolyngbyaceae cyanobacterium bins.59]
ILLLDVTPLSLGVETIGGVMKKLIPRNTTIPVRRSDVFSTSENNQTMVEIHVVQGEREMAAANKSLGRFKLTGIPPAPRGIPQILVALDIDANGILQVAALDKTTGREQSITIQDASTLAEEEVQRMLREAEAFAAQDREKRERIERRTDSESLITQSERFLRQLSMDYGIYYANDQRRRIEQLIQDLRTSLSENNDRGIDRNYLDLRDALYSLRREVYQREREENEEEDFLGSALGSIRRVFSGDDEDDYDSYRDREYGDRGYGDRGYGGGYDNRRPEERGYNDRGYNDRGYNDRGYNDREYDTRRSDDRRSDDRRSDDRRPERNRDRDYYEDSYRRSNSSGGRSIKPAQNDNWDEDEDDWL